jgi:hypothetical protein
LPDPASSRFQEQGIVDFVERYNGRPLTPGLPDFLTQLPAQDITVLA